MKPFFKTRCTAIVVMAAGYGWAGGHYIPVDSNLFAYLFQFVILGILLVLGFNYFSVAETYKANWPAKGLSIFSILFFLINVLNIVHGFFNTDPHSFGSHNTFADLVPIVIILFGAGLWISTIRTSKKFA